MYDTLSAVCLSKTYRQHVAVDNLYLQVKAGEIYCLLGPNGAGKTTTLNIFLGLTEPTSGKAMINGLVVCPTNLTEVRRQIAYIPEVVQLYGHLSGIENLDYFSKLTGFRYGTKQLAGFLHKAGLQQDAHSRRMSGYSKGMRQKVGIAIALAKNASVIFMDEPTSGLDAKAISDFSTICREVTSEGKTILMATHDLFNAISIKARIGIMEAGKLRTEVPAGRMSAPQLQELYLATV